MLLASGADPDIVYASGDAPLHVAVAKGLVGTVRALLKADANPSVRDGQGQTPLHLAELGSPIFKALLVAGAVYTSGDAPLHVAVSDGLVDTVGVLLEWGADPNIRDSQGRMPLHLAVVKRQLDLVEMLLATEADPNVQDKDGNTPLHEAVRLNQNRLRRMFGNVQVQFADLLVKGGANPCIQNNQGSTPIDEAEVSSTKKWLREYSQGWCRSPGR